MHDPHSGRRFEYRTTTLLRQLLFLLLHTQKQLRLLQLKLQFLLLLQQVLLHLAC